MNISNKALKMLEKYPLCDHCLGRQFALLGRSIENDERGKIIKSVLTMEAQALASLKDKKGMKTLKILATNGFFKMAEEILHKMGKRILSSGSPKTCFLCEDRFKIIDELIEKVLEKLRDYEYNNFLVGVEFPVTVEEHEDEFRAEFKVEHGESIRNEFGRLLGKKFSLRSGKSVEYRKPDVVVLINPVTEEVKLQVNPLYVAGYYRKLVRGIPQSRWLCPHCCGAGCEKCDQTGKAYPESVEELIEGPLLEATGGVKTSLHASGREDVDARMLGKGRPFVVEITQPKRRFLNLEELEEAINAYARGKVEVSNLRPVTKDAIRKLKKAESAQKEYRVIVEFEDEVTTDGLNMLEEKLTNVVVKQRTPARVLHRRADLTRERYVYEVRTKKLSPKRAEIRIRCQGGLYVKELVTGDSGRTVPSVSEILGNKTKPIKLDVLNVIMN